MDRERRPEKAAHLRTGLNDQNDGKRLGHVSRSRYSKIGYADYDSAPMTLLKSLERTLRRRFLAVTDRPFTGDFVTEPRDAFHLGDAPRILLLRQDRIGDVLVSIPVIRALRQRYPRAQIHMLFSRANFGVRHAVAQYVDHSWRYDKTLTSAVRVIRAVRAARYDIVVNLTDNPSHNGAALRTAWGSVTSAPAATPTPFRCSTAAVSTSWSGWRSCCCRLESTRHRCRSTSSTG
jgi:hypothetical protein